MRAVSEILTRGDEVLKAWSGFKLLGRDVELTELSSVLMRMRKRNLIITGRAGVGISSVVLGLFALKNDINVPLDIISKRFYWLSTDHLFESGNTKEINDAFKKVRQTLSKRKDAIIVIEDTIDFARAAQNNGCPHLIHGLMGDIKSDKYQVIFETNDDSLGEVLSIDSDVAEYCSLYELKEPNSENLRAILSQSKLALEKHHEIKISDKAVETAAMLTEKYKLSELRAQPDAAISLLDQSLTDFIQQIHIAPQHIESLRSQLRSSISESERQQLEEKIKVAEDDWQKRQESIRQLYAEISDGEAEVIKLEDAIARIREEQLKRAQALQQQEQNKLGTTAQLIASSNMDTAETIEIKQKIKKLNELITASSEEFRSSAIEVYKDLELEDSHVLKSFSHLSSIPVETLNEDERSELLELDNMLSERVIGQNEPTLEVAKSVKRSRLGLKMPNKPSGTFMFLGPSGVGKTELAKALAQALKVPLLRFDMSEYMEKHAVAKLIGAPPGYEGYEHGGILTNAGRKNPYSVCLFDEIEKAHSDVFNVMLQLLDDARLTDSRGLTASFKDTVVIMTTNIGTEYFLDPSIEFEEAKTLAKEALYGHYRPEFLGRFGGNIYCFDRLKENVLTQIARKDISRINQMIQEHGIHLDISEENLSSLINEKYSPREGARSILGYIDRHITSGVADLVLENNQAKGKIDISYDIEKQDVVLSLKTNSSLG